MNSTFSLDESHCYVYYYIREGLWRSLIHFCKDADSRYGDPFFIFWRAFAIYKEGNPSQAVNELQQIEKKRELQWATTKALIFYHNKCAAPDRRTVDQLNIMEGDFERKATDRATVAVAYFFMFNNDPDMARDVLSNCKFESPAVFCCKGWLEVMELKNQESKVNFNLT